MSASTINKPEINLEKDMREKACKICGKVKRIHKWDAFCKKCQNSAFNIRNRNGSIYH